MGQKTTGVVSAFPWRKSGQHLLRTEAARSVRTQPQSLLSGMALKVRPAFLALVFPGFGSIGVTRPAQGLLEGRERLRHEVPQGWIWHVVPGPPIRVKNLVVPFVGDIEKYPARFAVDSIEIVSLKPTGRASEADLLR